MTNFMLSKIYSRKRTGNKISYTILGIKLSYKKINKNKKVKFNINKLRKHIIKNIESSNVEYVSFDIFDTLLVRPCVNTSAIFELLAEKVNKKFNINFLKMRLNAEAGIDNASIYDIYNNIKAKYNLPEHVANELLQEEIAIESKLLSVRKDVKDFYDLAVANNKKIIAISDMYLPSDVLSQVLKKNGYDKIIKVYVSNEYKARKNEGELFKFVIDEVGTNKIFHIGDNKKADYIMAKKNSVKAGYYPSVMELLSSSNSLFYKMINGLNAKYSFSKSIFIGLTLNNYWFNKKSYDSTVLNSLQDFTNLFLAPYTCFIAFLMQKNALIQKLYKKIYFVARDGFLPERVYKLLNNGKYIPSEYVYASRVSYWTSIYPSFSALMKLYFCSSSSIDNDYSFHDFLNTYITDEDVYNVLNEKFSKQELSLPIKANLKKCLNLLDREKEIFENYYNNQKNLAKEYYSNIFRDDLERAVIFDVGYGGSVSIGLSKLVNKFIDKIYVRESDRNIQRDLDNQTYTYILKNGAACTNYGLDLLLEECFSPLEGTCKGFKNENGQVIPLTEDFTVSKEMQASHAEINLNTEFFVENLLNILGEYLDYIILTDVNPLIEFLKATFKNNKKQKGIFEHIIYNDIVAEHKQVSLKEKV